MPGLTQRVAISGRAWPLLAGAVYLLAFLALFRISGAFEMVSGVSTWYPAAGLRFAVLLLFGWRFGLVVAVADTVAGIILGMTGVSPWDAETMVSPGGLPGKLLHGLIPSLFYTLAAYFVFRWGRFDAGLTSYRDVICLCLAGVAASFCTALFSCVSLAANGFLQLPDVGPAIFGFWTGDMIGVLTLTPAILVGARLPQNRRIDFPRGFVPQTPGILLLEAALVTMFVAGAYVWAGDYGNPLRWYPFFLPIIWIALRFGIAGAAVGTLFVNTVVAMLAANTPGQAVPQDVQGLMIMLSIAGLLIGGVVSELSAERVSLDRRVRERTAELRSEVERRKKAEDRAVRERDRAENYLSIAEALIVALDRNARITLINREGCRVLGYALEEIIGRDWFDFAVPEEERTRSRAAHERLFDGDQLSSTRFQAAVVTRAGERRMIEWRNTVLTGEDGVPAGSLSSGLDITERVNAELRMRYLATHDTTTGLRNRNWLRDHLGAALARARRRDTLVGLLFIDLDGFKRINDDFGHEAGDALLAEVAGRLTGCVREADGVIRFGGDEFVIVLEDLASPADGPNVAEKILRALSQEILLGEQRVGIGASIGIAFYRRDGTTVDALLNAADAAMYLAKNSGRNGCRLAEELRDETTGPVLQAGE